MEQLLKVTTTRFHAVHFRESARFVPANNIDLERRKAVARQSAFRARHSGAFAGPDLKAVNQINTAFGKGRSNPLPVSAPKQPKTSGGSGVQADVYQKQPQPSSSSFTANLSAKSYAPSASMDTAVDVGAGNAVLEAAAAPQPVSVPVSAAPSAPIFSQLPESQASYNIERGSFELRVAKGEVTFVPALEMTIITQLPEIHFEYLGGFNYVPPSSDPAYQAAMNLSI